MVFLLLQFVCVCFHFLTMISVTKLKGDITIKKRISVTKHQAEHLINELSQVKTLYTTKSFVQIFNACVFKKVEFEITN